MIRRLKVDLPSLLSRNGIDFIVRGANVKKGNINIKCPFCGAGDPSHHMGIFPETGGYACWRNKNHRGRHPAGLWAKLLNISFGQACRMLGLNEGPDLSEFATVRKRMEEPKTAEKKAARTLTFPREFRAITEQWPVDTFWHYLHDSRGFDDVDTLTGEYELRAAVTGDFKGRVILPVFEGGQLVSWTARSVHKDATLRYKDLEIDKSVVPIKEVLYNGDEVQTARYLVVVEGPVDVLKADFYGRAFGFRAVGLFTNSLSDQQLYKLMDSADRVERVFIAMDLSKEEHVIHSMSMVDRLGVKNAYKLRIPSGYKDFGDVPPHRLINFFEDLYESIQ